MVPGIPSYSLQRPNAPWGHSQRRLAAPSWPARSWRSERSEPAPQPPPRPAPLQQAALLAATAAAAAVLALAPAPAAAATARACGTQPAAASFQQPAPAPRGLLASSPQLRHDFDRRQAQQWLEDYRAYVEGQAEREAAPGCEFCRANRTLLEKSWETVANQYFDPYSEFSQAAWARQLLLTLQEAGGVLPSKQATYAASQRLVGALGDPHSRFLPPSEFRIAIRQPRAQEWQALAAQRVGTGLVLGAQDAASAGWCVEAALAGSPAEEAGLVRGDRLLSVGGRPVAQLGAAKVQELLAGEEGSSVRLGWQDAEGRQHQAQVGRRALAQPPVKHIDLAGPDGQVVRYLRLYHFSSPAAGSAGAGPRGTAAAVAAAVEEGERQGVAGYILDLRDNPGGSFDAAIETTTFFLGDGDLITSTRYQWFGSTEVSQWRAGQLSPQLFPDPRGRLTDKPLALLVNSSTASASEVLAGALVDNGRAVLVGSQTYGKGTVQDYFWARLDAEGSGLQLTVAAYLTPSGYDISRQGGLQPSLACADHPRAWAGDAGDSTEPLGQAPDGCVAAALEALAPGQQPGRMGRDRGA